MIHLSDVDLWAHLMPRRAAVQLAGLPGLDDVDVDLLTSLPGIGPATAGRVEAVVELGRRLARHRWAARPRIGDAGDVRDLLLAELAHLHQEVVVALALDARHRVLRVVEVARGGPTGVEVSPVAVFRPLIRLGAAATILAHNHPSGDPGPSQQDAAMTTRVQAAGELLGLPVLDHVIVTVGSYYSFSESRVWQDGE